MKDVHDKSQVVVIGAGFTGLAAAYEIARQGVAVTVLEKDDHIGGLAGDFKTDEHRLEKFYHHWFTSDEHILRLAKELGCEDRLLYIPPRTGIYLDNKFFKLSTPLDVLRFKPLNLLGRLRLALLVVRAKLLKDWKKLESLTAEEWLLKLCGKDVYNIVWEPLLRGKFGPFAHELSAVYIWNKLVLRGGSRDRTGREILAYYHGGFGAFAERIADEIKSAGGVIETGNPAESLVIQDGRIRAVRTRNGTIDAQAVIATPAFPIIADLLGTNASEAYIAKLKRIKYLTNVCLVLELSQSLSNMYWLNVTDKDFPFVGVIEHTQFAELYGDKHIIYLSKYLSETDELYRMNKESVFEFSLPYIKRMFPDFEQSWVRRYHVWKARYAQPVIERHYSQLISPSETPIEGLHIATMAQIYPEDRGTNYAIRQGRHVGKVVANKITNLRN